MWEDYHLQPFPLKAARSREEAEFYSSYKPMEGVMTALVLGGFFVFVCLLVLYKTQCKPMWKNRQEHRQVKSIKTSR